MSLSLLADVLGACNAPTWSGSKDAVDLVVRRDSISFQTFRDLELCGVYAEKIYSPLDGSAQIAFNAGKPGQLPSGAKFRLKLPRIVGECVVARDLDDLLSITSTVYKAPRMYFLVCVGEPNATFCYLGPQCLLNAPTAICRYHEALRLWQTLEGQAEHCVTASRTLLFFGLRRTEIIPRFAVKDLAEDLAVDEIFDFIANQDRAETRKEIFRSVLSEFLQNQSPDRAFSYLLRQSVLFARRLKEGLAIYLSEHSPEWLAKAAQASYLGLAENLEKIVSGMEAKSLSIPAAVLLAVKEVEFGAKWTTLNALILIATALYFVTMCFVFASQRAVLDMLKKTIQKSVNEFQEQGLDSNNPILSYSFSQLETRRSHTQLASRFILAFSVVPILAVLYAAFLAAPAALSGYTLRLAPTNGVQIISISNAQVLPLTVPQSRQGTTNP